MSPISRRSAACRSSFNIVADWYPIDHGVLKKIATRGFELGVHGVRHDSSMFSSRAEFERQLPAVERWAETLEASGFRSPATHRVVDWLAELPVAYNFTSRTLIRTNPCPAVVALRGLTT